MLFVDILGLLILLIALHFVCDYPLQGDFLAKAKNHTNPIPGVPYWQALTAHSVIHGGAVYIATGSVLLFFVEVVLHWIIDKAKCAGKLSFNEDQALHIIAKVFYVAYIFLIKTSG